MYVNQDLEKKYYLSLMVNMFREVGGVTQ